MYSEALYFAERETRFFQFNFKNQFSPIIAFKSEAEGASLWLVCHVAPFPSSPPIRLLFYLADVHHWAGNYLQNQNPVTRHPAAPKTACRARVNPHEGAVEWVRTHTHTHTHTHPHTNPTRCLKKPPALHSLIKSTHRSPITPVRGYLQSQDGYRLFLQTLLQGLQRGRKISPMRSGNKPESRGGGLGRGLFLS